MPIAEEIKTAEPSVTKLKVRSRLLLEEILCNSQVARAMRIPVQIFDNILGEVAARAIELNDLKLNALMCRLALYSISDPTSSDYDSERTKEIINKAYQE